MERHSVERIFLKEISLRQFVPVLFATIALSLTSCVQSNSVKSPTTSEAVTLRISVQPTQNRAEQEQMIAPLDAHLEKVLGQPVEFLVAKDYKDSVDMLVDGRANAAYIGALSYFEALERGAKVRPLVAPIDQYTTRPWYRACIIVPANSPIKTLADLKGKKVAFVNRSSTSGYLKPVAALKQLGIDPDRDFAEVIFGGTHEKTEALLGKQADAIATNIASYKHWKEEGKSTVQAAKVIWQSEPLFHAPVLVSEQISPALIEKLKEAFLTTPEGIQDLMGAKTVGYTLVDAEDYKKIRELRHQLNQAMEP
ncbi:MAG: phosphate/phosphite/phosphonate ABC transporter substrate-binding protein [Leptolyngbya sp. Prado105]|nr:phosphate/phosphite/phosphonate ABC transporter substrate-binding protein [Leptolyngbya sp. Prado105]